MRTLPFSDLCCSHRTGHWPFSFWFCLWSFSFWFCLWFCLCFCFLVFLGRVNVAGGVDLDDWLEVRLVTTAAGDWLMVSWVAATGDWLEVCWVEAAGDWLAVRWSAGEGDWLEVCWVAGEGDRLKVRWVAGAEFGLSWPKVSVYSSFWVDKIWIDAFGANTLVTDLLFSNDISRYYWFNFSYKSCIRIIHYIFNASVVITFNWVKQCKNITSR